MSATTDEVDFILPIQLALKTGILNLAFKDLSCSNLKRILRCLAQKEGDDGRQYRPRKCRRLEGFDCVIASLRNYNTRPIWKLNLVGNETLGDAAMELLPLLPTTVCALDISRCGLSSVGIGALCRFMKTNRTITKLDLWGNPGLEAKKENEAIGQAFGTMLLENSTLEELCIWPPSGELNDDTVIDIAFSLARNTGLRVLEMSHDTARVNTPPAESTFGAQQRKSWSLAMFLRSNRNLERISFGGLPENDPTGDFFWEETGFFMSAVT